MNNGDHLLPEYRANLQLSDEERLASIKKRWIDHEFADYLFKLLVGRIRNEQEMPDLFICGDSDMGKTTLVQRFISLYGASYIEDYSTRIKPVLHVEVPTVSVKLLYWNLLRTSLSPVNPDSTEMKLRAKAVNMLTDCKTKMIIVDEIQTIERGTNRERADFMNEIKFLGNSLGISIVFVGTNNAKSLLKLDPQYANRFNVVDVPAWGPTPAFRQFLKAYEMWLPLKRPSNLSSRELATYILLETKGNTGHVERMVLSSARRAIETGRECIDLELLEKSLCKTGDFGIQTLAQ